jgi:hypothetical protein
MLKTSSFREKFPHLMRFRRCIRAAGASVYSRRSLSSRRYHASKRFRERNLFVIEERSRRRKAVWPLLMSLGLVTLLVFVAACGGGAESRQHAEEEQAAEETQAMAKKSQVASEEARNTGADLENPSLGDENAPVVMVEYADYQ